MRNVFSVTEVNKYIKNKLTSDTLLSHLFISGEISNLTKHSSGHLYFTLKDQESSIKCVMFKSQAYTLRFNPEHGMKIIAGGYISVFEKTGEYQVYVQDMQPDGVGALHVAFEQLKEKLEKEGLFDIRHKKRLPILPQKICIVTSPTGAAIRDILDIITRRFQNIEIIIIPVHVQGELAAKEISEAIEFANISLKPDLIITGRGGGSIEDLWAFNEEIVARSIYNSEAPIISSVGHETDFTIADFVADLRAPTPSAAAELAVPEYSLLLNTILTHRHRLVSGLIKLVSIKKEKLLGLTNRSVFENPVQNLNQFKQQIDNDIKAMQDRLFNKVNTKKDKLGFLIEKLIILNPLNVLKRGYSTIKNIDNHIIESVLNVCTNDQINVILKDGELCCIVKNIKVMEEDTTHG